jgi:L-asparaginase II
MTVTSITEDYVVTDRGGIVENMHRVHAAVVDAHGRLLFAVGNPSRITLTRSAAKPAQALAVLEAGACDQFGFNEPDLALMCASHNSEERHIERASAMLAKIKGHEDDLRCGGHPANSPTVNNGWIRNGFTPTAIYNNCSGKHVGMLAGSLAIGAPVLDYHLPKHPMQLRVRRVFEELSGLDESEVSWGIDGCNLPAPACPLDKMARMFAVVANAPDATVPSPDTRTKHLASIFHAMSRYPEMIGGDGRFCTNLMRTFQGSLIGKVGADGCYGVGVRASEQTKRLGAEGSLGIAVKIEDGSLEILYSVVTEILEQLHIGTPEMLQQLDGFHHLQRLNTMNVVTGNVSLAFKVRPC